MLDRMLLPPAVWTTFPAGWGNLPKATCGRLYACGLKAGMPDILVFFNGFTLGVELKVPGRSPSSKQRSMFAKLQAAGVPVMICHSMEEVYDALEYRCFPLRRAFKWNTSSA
jgi:hypothetical protein